MKLLFAAPCHPDDRRATPPTPLPPAGDGDEAATMRELREQLAVVTRLEREEAARRRLLDRERATRTPAPRRHRESRPQ